VRHRRVLVAAALLVVAGGAAGAALALRSSNPNPAVGSECGTSVPGRGFRVFACESGGAGSGHGHPKELLVIRKDGSSVAYPAFRIAGLAVGDGKVVAAYNVGLVRVTSRRLVPLLTLGGLARALHIPRTAIMDVYDLRADAHGDVHFIASVLRHPGCQNLVLERTVGGAVRQLGTSTVRGIICG
jgi:hypothetical protein